MESDPHAKDVTKRMGQLRAVVDLLREQLHRSAGNGSSNSSRPGGDLSEQELLKAAAYIQKLAAALDRGLERQQHAAAAHSACIARDRRVADKMNECVGGLLSAGALAEGLALQKPYVRHRQTIHL